MWDSIKIKDFGTVITGTTPPSKKPEQFGEDYPFITPSDMDNSRRVVTQRGISAKGATVHSRKLLPKNSVCFVCIGATIGKICLTTSKSLTNQQINSIIVDKSKHDPFFVYYLLSTYSDTVKSIAGGVATPIVNKTSFENINAIAPLLTVQHRIASILSAYDDLIENNTRRIQILEEMAQRIYTEWFIHFRFPGHEKVKMVDSELGRIPSGWEIESLSSKASMIKRGIAPKYNDEAECRVINQRCIRNFRLDLTLSRRQSKKVPEERFVQVGDVLINSTGVGTLGRVAQVYEHIENCTVDTHVTIVRPEVGIDLTYWGNALMVLQANFENLGAGTTGQTELSRLSIGDVQNVFAPDTLQTRYGQIVSPLRKNALLLQRKNANLRQTRDLLLPKLISGEIDVSEMPDIEEAAAA